MAGVSGGWAHGDLMASVGGMPNGWLGGGPAALAGRLGKWVGGCLAGCAVGIADKGGKREGLQGWQDSRSTAAAAPVAAGCGREPASRSSEK